MEKEYPILFSTDMVRANQKRRKTETRRCSGLDKFNESPNDWEYVGFDGVSHIMRNLEDKTCIGLKSRYGNKGDGLYVRETFHLTDHGYALYKADFDPVCEQLSLGKDEEGKEIMVKVTDYKWKPAIHIPKSLSRTRLLNKGVRIERLHDIDQDGSQREGIDFIKKRGLTWFYSYKVGRYFNHFKPRQSFRTLWDKINSKQKEGRPDLSWKANPFVWVIQYEIIE